MPVRVLTDSFRANAVGYLPGWKKSLCWLFLIMGRSVRVSFRNDWTPLWFVLFVESLAYDVKELFVWPANFRSENLTSEIAEEIAWTYWLRVKSGKNLPPFKVNCKKIF